MSEPQIKPSEYVCCECSERRLIPEDHSSEGWFTCPGAMAARFTRGDVVDAVSKALSSRPLMGRAEYDEETAKLVAEDFVTELLGETVKL